MIMLPSQIMLPFGPKDKPPQTTAEGYCILAVGSKYYCAEKSPASTWPAAAQKSQQARSVNQFSFRYLMVAA